MEFSVTQDTYKGKSHKFISSWLVTKQNSEGKSQLATRILRKKLFYAKELHFCPFKYLIPAYNFVLAD
jgi:hypothetical protein